MRFYDNGRTKSWAKEYTSSDDAKCCLYLVPDPNNKHDKNAIMLHDGKKLRGYVQASEAPHIAEMLKGTDDVYCVYISQIGNLGYSHGEPTYLRVTAFCKVDERLARKFKCEPLSKPTPSTHKTLLEEKQQNESYKAEQKLKADVLWESENAKLNKDSWVPDCRERFRY